MRVSRKGKPSTEAFGPSTLRHELRVASSDRSDGTPTRIHVRPVVAAEAS